MRHSIRAGAVLMAAALAAGCATTPEEDPMVIKMNDLDRRLERIEHPGYGCCDAFYRAPGKHSALRTCNTWAAKWLRLAGVKASVWPPFVNGLVWRYRQSSPGRGGGSPKG